MGREEVAVGPVAVRFAVDERDDRIEPVRIQQDRRSAVRHIGHDLEARPQPRRPGHGDGMATEIERLGGRARVQHWDVQVGH